MKKSIATIQELENSNAFTEDVNNIENIESLESNTIEENDISEGKDTFTWPEKAVLLFLELYREREQEFTSGLKRHNKLWSEIASELQKSNYNVSGVQVRNKMSGLKRTYKKIKDSNVKSGNYNSCWAYYNVMDSLFGKKSWVSPPATASSDGPTTPNALASSSCYSLSPVSSVDNFERQDISCSKPKKRRVEIILETYISDLKSNKNQMQEERKKERLEKEERKQQRWEERREMHKETSEIQRSLVNIVGQLLQKENKPK